MSKVAPLNGPLNGPLNDGGAPPTLFESGTRGKKPATLTTPQSIAVHALVDVGFPPAEARRFVADAGAKQVHIALANARYYQERGHVGNFRGLVVRAIRDRHPLTDGLRQQRKAKQADAKRVAEALRRQAQNEQQAAAARDARAKDLEALRAEWQGLWAYIDELDAATFDAAAATVIARAAYLRPGPGTNWRRSKTLCGAIRRHLAQQPAGVAV